MAKTTVLEVPASGAAAIEGRAAGGELQKKARSLDGLARLVGEFMAPEIFAGERDRVYNSWVTFIAFLGQALTRGSSCREGVREPKRGLAADLLIFQVNLGWVERIGAKGAFQEGTPCRAHPAFNSRTPATTSSTGATTAPTCSQHRGPRQSSKLACSRPASDLAGSCTRM